MDVCGTVQLCKWLWTRVICFIVNCQILCKIVIILYCRLCIRTWIKHCFLTRFITRDNWTKFACFQGWSMELFYFVKGLEFLGTCITEYWVLTSYMYFTCCCFTVSGRTTDTFTNYYFVYFISDDSLTFHASDNIEHSDYYDMSCNQPYSSELSSTLSEFQLANASIPRSFGEKSAPEW